MIFNLSQPVGKSVNDNILEARNPVKYFSVHEVGQHLLSFSHRKTWLATVDLTDAYRGCILQPVLFVEQTLGIMCLSLHSYRF